MEKMGSRSSRRVSYVKLSTLSETSPSTLGAGFRSPIVAHAFTKTDRPYLPLSFGMVRGIFGARHKATLVRGIFCARHKATLVRRGQVIREKRCKFQAAVVAIDAAQDVASAKAAVLGDRRVRKASHPLMCAWSLDDGAVVGHDDGGERGAGRVLGECLRRAHGVEGGVFLAVTRWYGGAHLGAARFRAIARCGRETLAGCEWPHR